MSAHFDNMHQTSAFETGKVTHEEAKRFYSWYQVFALNSGEVSLEEALAFDNSDKFNLVRTAEKSIKEAISSIVYIISGEELIQEWPPTCPQENDLFKYDYLPG